MYKLAKDSRYFLLIFESKYKSRFAELKCLRSYSDTSNYLKDLKPRPFDENNKDIWISPPHPQSNLRLKVFPATNDLTNEEKEFYKKYEETQNWNQKYWVAHNENFKESKQLYIARFLENKNLPKDYVLTDDDMSNFHQEFLQQNYNKHRQYNWDWYKRNFTLLALSVKVNLAKMKKYLTER